MRSYRVFACGLIPGAAIIAAMWLDLNWTDTLIVGVGPSSYAPWARSKAAPKNDANSARADGRWNSTPFVGMSPEATRYSSVNDW